MLASTFMGGSGIDVCYSLALDTSGNVYVTGYTYSTDFPTTSGVYDTSRNGNYDIFVSKLNGGLTKLLASTYLGGSGGAESCSITLDRSGNVYVTGLANSTDFPTTSGAYDTSYNGGRSDSSGAGDAFISKLDGELTNLLASTYLGGSSSYDKGYSIAVDASGNVYVTGETGSSDFPTTSGVYDASQNGSSADDVFISKLDSGLTSLLASTFLGGSGYDRVRFLTLDTSGNVYVTGYTGSTNFPTMSEAYDASQNGSNSSYDVFVSKLDGGLTSLLASTYLGGSNDEIGYSLAHDTSGNVYVTGRVASTDFPTTSGAYDTSFNGSGSHDVFVSKLDGGLTSLLASTYLGGSSNDVCYSLALDTSGNVYVAGNTASTNFPTTNGAYDASQNDSNSSSSDDVFISKLDGGLTSLLASTYLGGSHHDACLSLALDTSGNVYVTGYTGSTNFPSTSGAYDTYYGGYSNGNYEVFVSKLDSNLSAFSTSAPTVSTGSTSNVTSSTATLNGTVNANGLSTTAWFNYGITSGSYTGTSTTRSVSGSNDTTVSIGISGLSSNTTYYYRLAASNSAGTSYGSENSFTTSTTLVTPTPTPTTTDTAAPSGAVSINNGASYTNSTATTLSLSATDNVGVVGYYVSNNSSTPTASASGWNAVTSTTGYLESISYTLTIGDEQKTVYVWYKDSAVNVSIAASDSIILDTTAPIVTITSPTSSDTFTTTSSPLNLSGSASDISSGVKEVTWSNDKGGSGTANGTIYWSISSISLTSGENRITVAATDGAGNTSTDTLTITYNPITAVTPTPTTSPAPTLPPLPTPVASPSPVPPLPPLPTPKASPSPIPECIVFGIVNDESDNPLKDVTVTITDNNVSNNTTTDDDGYYEFAELAAGSYTLTYEMEDYKSQSLEISIEAGETKELEVVTMEEVVMSTIYGYVVNIQGDSIEDTRVRLKGIRTKVSKSTASDADGFFEFTDLEADTYLLFAKKKRFKKAKVTVRLKEGEDEEIEIEMKRTSKRINVLILEEDVQ